MAFERLAKSPPRSDFLSIRELVLMSDEQYDTEREYWERIRALGGFWQIEFAGDFMLDLTMTAVGHFREAAADLDRAGLPYEQAGPVTQNYAAKAITGLSLGALVRSTIYNTALTQGNVRINPTSIGIDADLSAYPPFGYVHERKDRLTGMLPGYDPAAGAAVYREGSLVVNIGTKAMTTLHFAEGFANAGDGTDFDPTAYATLRPRLLKTFVTEYTPPPTPA